MDTIFLGNDDQKNLVGSKLSKFCSLCRIISSECVYIAPELSTTRQVVFAMKSICLQLHAKYEGNPSIGIHKHLKQKLLLLKQIKGDHN